MAWAENMKRRGKKEKKKTWLGERKGKPAMSQWATSLKAQNEPIRYYHTGNDFNRRFDRVKPKQFTNLITDCFFFLLLVTWSQCFDFTHVLEKSVFFVTPGFPLICHQSVDILFKKVCIRTYRWTIIAKGRTPRKTYPADEFPSSWYWAVFCFFLNSAVF